MLKALRTVVIRRKLEQAVISKLTAEGLSFASDWPSIEQCLSRVVAPTRCIAVARTLKDVRGADRRYRAEIAGRTVVCQSCWVDGDLDIQANIGITNGYEDNRRTNICYHKIQISLPESVTYPGLVVYGTTGRWELSFEGYDTFLKENFQAVLELILSLLEPAELVLLTAYFLPEDESYEQLEMF